MPNKRTFDLIVVTGLLLHGVIGLFRIESRRLANEEIGALGTIGAAGLVLL